MRNAHIQSWRKYLLSLSAIAALGLASSAKAGLMFEFRENQVTANIDSDNYDMAIGGGQAHVAYQNGGSIYYTSRGLHSAQWSSPILIGSGTTPSIAAGPGGAVHIAYQNGGNIFESASGNGFSSNVVSPGSYGSIGVSANGTRHLLIEGNFDGDGYVEIGHRSNGGAGWSPVAILHDGAYADGSGNYFGQSSLAARADGSFAYALEQQVWGGKASWSNKYPSAIIPGGPGASMGVDWNIGSNISRNAIADGPDGVGFVFSTGGTVYANVMMGGDWVGFLPIGTGSQASADMSIGLASAFSDGGKIMLFDGLVTTQIEVDSVGLIGSNPIIGGDGTDLYVLYRDGSGSLDLVTTVVTPEPGTVATILTGAGVLLLRRRSR